MTPYTQQRREAAERVAKALERFDDLGLDRILAGRQGPGILISDLRELSAGDPSPGLIEALEKAQDIIDQTRMDLHSRRVADWFPEGAHNAAAQMSEDMRLIGNRLADVDFSAALRHARGEAA